MWIYWFFVGYFQLPTFNSLKTLSDKKGIGCGLLIEQSKTHFLFAFQLIFLLLVLLSVEAEIFYGKKLAMHITALFHSLLSFLRYSEFNLSWISKWMATDAKDIYLKLTEEWKDFGKMKIVKKKKKKLVMKLKHFIFNFFAVECK